MPNRILLYHYNLLCGLLLSNFVMNHYIVTRFGKTIPVHTRIEIHFIAYYNSHTQGLSKRSAFTDGFLLTLSSHAGPTQTLWGRWGAL